MLQGREGISLTQMSDTIVMLARAKLLGHQYTEAPADDLDSSGLLAVVDVRLCLEYEPLNSQLALQTQADLVAHHMRLAYSVPKHRHYFRSGYSSEPILAEVSVVIIVIMFLTLTEATQAATQQLNHWRTKNKTILIDALNQKMNTGLLDRGERGEVVARALITEAYDRATLRRHERNKPKYPLSMGCGVIEFVEEFVRDHGMITEAYPDNVKGGVTFREAFKHAVLRITHWVRAQDDHILNTDSMAPAFIRGAAFICRRGEAIVDLMAPILLWDEKIAEWVMSSFFWQIKLNKKKGKYQINAEDLGFFPPQERNRNPSSDDNPFTKPLSTKRPYITMVMDLGVLNPPPGHAKFPVQNAVEKFNETLPAETTVAPKATTARSKAKAAVPSSVYPGTPSKLKVGMPVTVETRRTPTPENTHPRYAIYASGCSDTVYAVIEPDQRTKYHQLLRQDELLTEHPRPRTIPQVLNMKPFWRIGPACYSWYDSPLLNGIIHQPSVQADVLRVPRFGESLEADYNDGIDEQE